MQKDIIKIESVEQWMNVVIQYKSLLQGDTSLKEHGRNLKSVKSKLESYIRTSLIETNKEARDRKKQLNKAKKAAT
jgi:hypothetical protein